MKKNYTYIIAISLGLLVSCTDVLDQKPLDTYTDEAIWSDLALSETVLNGVYTSIQGELQRGSRFASFTDELYQMHLYGTDNVTQGRLSPDIYGFGWDDSMWDAWGYNYGVIKNINNFLEKIDNVPAETAEEQEWKNWQTGQAHFLRAYFYHQLYSLFGRVPIITRTYGLEDDYFEGVTRNSLDEVADFIVQDCDAAAALLPLQYSDDSDLGRATKGAALALKGRTLLYAASPLFGTPSAEKWAKASAANKAVIDLGVYTLPVVENSEDYANLFVTNQNSESIFQQQYNTQYEGAVNMIFLYQAPAGPGNGFNGWGNFQPTQNIVDRFERADGTPYIQSSPRENPYLNRDLRFAACIFHDGCLWGYGADEREVEVFYGADGLTSGKDSQWGDVWWNGTKTGYYIRKFMNRNYDANGTEALVTPTIIFRLAESYLNYAECQIELGNTAEAIQYINAIRNRVHLPGITADNIVEKYRKERQIELLFEGQRYFDIKRWKTIENEYTKPIYGVLVTKHKDGNSTYKTYEQNSIPISTRNFNAPQNYWMPVPRYEMRRNPNLDAEPYE